MGIGDGTVRTILRTINTLYVDLMARHTGASNPHPQYIIGSGSLPLPADTVTDGTSFGNSPDAGVADEYSRADHDHGTPPSPGSAFFVGFTTYYQGLAADIPAGWHLSDGGTYNGFTTKNLKSLFLVGADQEVAGVWKTNVEGALTVNGGDINYTPQGTNADEATHRHDMAHIHGTSSKAGTGLATVRDAGLLATNSGPGQAHDPGRGVGHPLRRNDPHP